MITKEEQTKLNNDKILLDSLRNDIIEVVNALSQTYKEREEQSTILEQNKSEMAVLEERKAEIFFELEEERKSIKQSKIELESFKVRSLNELNVLDKQKRSAMSELRRLNEWNFEVIEEKKGLDENIKALLLVEREKKTYILDIEVFKKKVEEVKEHHRSILVDIKLAEDESEASLYKNKKEVIRMQDIVDILQEKKDKAEYALADSIKQKYEIEVDLKIYEDRVDKKYTKAFPTKKIKLIKK